MAEVDMFAALDDAITDACRFLNVARPEFYELARGWDTHRDTTWAETNPETFYTAWRGDVGRAALAANVLDQFSRPEIWHVTQEIRRQTPLGFFLDYGCGSAVVTWTALPSCTEAVLVDVPNLNQEFVRWRLEQHDSHQAAVLTPEEAAVFPAGTFDTIFCIDVLEHLPQPTAIFERLDQALKTGGLLLHRSPWARPDEDLCEHLAEATVDWHRPGGGAEQLAARYQTLAPLPFGGLYLKR